MIFVILGTQQFPFDRLLKKLDAYVAEGLLKDEIVAQIGYSTYKPRNFPFQQFFDRDAFGDLVQKADLIVTHGGVGSVLTANRAGKPTVAVPRLAKYGEHVDDHQCELTGEFARRGIVLECLENDDLLALINKSRTMTVCAYHREKQGIVPAIRNYLEKTGE